MNKPVSVIISAFNEERHIASCLDSILKQNYKPLEVIVIDDGSTDNTKNLIKPFTNIKYWYLRHQGTALARIFGAKQTHGVILVFVDADMIFKKDFISYLVKPINENKTKGTFSKLEYVANWNMPLARCWNRNNYPPLPDRLRVPQDKNEGEDFRAILKSEFVKVNGFDNIGYTDTWTLSKKLCYKPINAPDAVYYHNNPDSYMEVYQSARWIGKRQYKMNKIGSVINIIRSFVLISIIRGLIRGFKYHDFTFIPFQIVYDFGLTVGALDKIFFNRINK